jgi:tRNA1(Val) A37 N6-methylase TrmN6
MPNVMDLGTANGLISLIIFPDFSPIIAAKTQFF